MTKHVATPEGQTGRVRIEKKVFDTPADEVKTRVAVLKQTQPSLTEDQARQQVLAEHPHLYPSHVAAMRQGVGESPAWSPHRRR